jgi:hypothetical protein
MVATTGAAPALVATKLAMLPAPLAAKPIEGVSLTQLNVVPATAPVNVMSAVLAPLHNTWSVGSTTVGVGFTVIVKFVVLPAHPLNTGVTVMVDTTGVLPVFTPANAAMLPLPLAASPIEVFVLVQLNVVPPTAPLNVMAVVLAPLQTTWLPTTATVGVG